MIADDYPAIRARLAIIQAEERGELIAPFAMDMRPGGLNYLRVTASEVGAWHAAFERELNEAIAAAIGIPAELLGSGR